MLAANRCVHHQHDRVSKWLNISHIAQSCTNDSGVLLPSD